MNYGEFIYEFDDVIQVFGKDEIPKPTLERAFMKVRDLSSEQLKEVCNMLIDTCRFPPKVPDVVECANIVRARHREGIRGDGAGEPGPRTPEVGREALATITSILSKRKP